MKSIILHTWKKTTSIAVSLVTLTTFAVYNGNLFDRVTSNFLENTSYLFQSNGEIGWIISLFLSSIIVLGSFYDWISLTQGSNLDLIVSMLMIYFIVSIGIGRAMKGYDNLGGFLLGFLTPFYLNYIVYSAIYIFSSVTGSFFIINLVEGFYGIDNIIVFLIVSGIINGIVLGVFGYFWTTIFNVYFYNKHTIPVTKICSSISHFCISVKKHDAAIPIVFKESALPSLSTRKKIEK